MLEIALINYFLNGIDDGLANQIFIICKNGIIFFLVLVNKQLIIVNLWFFQMNHIVYHKNSLLLYFYLKLTGVFLEIIIELLQIYNFWALRFLVGLIFYILGIFHLVLYQRIDMGPGGSDSGDGFRNLTIFRNNHIQVLSRHLIFSTEKFQVFFILILFQIDLFR